MINHQQENVEATRILDMDGEEWEEMQKQEEARIQEEKDESTFFLISGRPAGPGAPQASRQLQVDLTTQVRYCGNNRNILRITVRHALSHWLLW